MKNTGLFFLVILIMFPVVSFSQSANGPGENPILERLITCKYTDVTLKNILTDLNEKQGIYFNFIDEEIPLDKRFTLEVVDQPFDIVLKSIFAELDIVYFLIGSQIVLQYEEEKRYDTLEVYASTERINEDIIKKKDTLNLNPKSKEALPEINKVNIDNSSLKEVTEFKKNQALNLKNEKLSIGGFYSPEYSVQQIKNNDSEMVNDKSFTHGSIVTSSFGLSVNYFFKSNWFIRTGLLYQTFGEKGELTVYTEQQMNFAILPKLINQPKGPFEPFPVTQPSTDHPNQFPNPGPYPNQQSIDRPAKSPMGGSLASNSSNRSAQGSYPVNGTQFPKQGTGSTTLKTYKDTTISYSQVYSYLSLPIGVGYRLGNKKYFSLSTGVLVNYLAGSKFKQSAEVSEAGSILKEYNYKKITETFYCSIETGVRFNRLSISVAPSFKYFLSSIYSSSEKVSNKPYSWGVSLGASYTIAVR